MECFIPPVRYKIAHGGRGSSKSWSIARLLIIKAYKENTRILCARETQKSITDSVLQLLSDQITLLGLDGYFEVQKTQILGVNGSRFLFEGLRSNITKIKSMEGIDVVWVEEAESVTFTSWETLIPTIRKKGSEIWVSFNPRDEMDDTYQRFIEHPQEDSVITEVNYNDNPWFPEELEKERLHLEKVNWDLYEHVWLGKCFANREGAYYSKYLQSIKEQITRVPVEPGLRVSTYWDLGVSDSTAIWFVQNIGMELRVIDCYEAHGEGLQHYIKHLYDFAEKHNIIYDRHVAPHDIRVRELTNGKSRLDTARKLGINFHVAPNLSIEEGIHSTRQILHRCWFDAERCKEGLKSLRNYRKEFDESKGVYKNNPLHDWTSHFSDAFRYFAISWKDNRKNYSKPVQAKTFNALG